MKKVLAIILIGIMILSTGCNKSDTQKSEITTENVATTTENTVEKETTHFTFTEIYKSLENKSDLETILKLFDSTDTKKESENERLFGGNSQNTSYILSPQLYGGYMVTPTITEHNVTGSIMDAKYFSISLEYKKEDVDLEELKPLILATLRNDFDYVEDSDQYYHSFQSHESSEYIENTRVSLHMNEYFIKVIFYAGTNGYIEYKPK